MLALSLSDKFCCFGIFVFVFNRFLFSRFSFLHFFVLALVNENHTAISSSQQRQLRRPATTEHATTHLEMALISDRQSNIATLCAAPARSAPTLSPVLSFTEQNRSILISSINHIPYEQRLLLHARTGTGAVKRWHIVIINETRSGRGRGQEHEAKANSHEAETEAKIPLFFSEKFYLFWPHFL